MSHRMALQIVQVNSGIAAFITVVGFAARVYADMAA
jgi:hypothetical protein